MLELNIVANTYQAPGLEGLVPPAVTGDFTFVNDEKDITNQMSGAKLDLSDTNLNSNSFKPTRKSKLYKPKPIISGLRKLLTWFSIGAILFNYAIKSEPIVPTSYNKSNQGSMASVQYDNEVPSTGISDEQDLSEIKVGHNLKPKPKKNYNLF